MLSIWVLFFPPFPFFFLLALFHKVEKIPFLCVNQRYKGKGYGYHTYFLSQNPLKKIKKKKEGK